MLKEPQPDPGLDAFRDGIAVLRRDGQVAGHVASAVSTFWSPSMPLSGQWEVWFVVVWTNGDREPRFEDYPPWTIVREIQSGTLLWDEAGAHEGTYTAEWLTGADLEAARSALGLTADDF